MHPVTAAQLTTMGRMGAWITDVVSAPYPGSGFVRPGKPVCPYTADAMAVGTVLLALVPGVDGSDPTALDAVMDDALEWFLANVHRDQFLHSLVVGFPDVPFMDDALEHGSNRLRDKRMAHHVIASGMFQDTMKDAAERTYPDGIDVPVPCFVLRYLSPYDNRFLDRAPHLLEAFLERFATEVRDGTLPRAAVRQIRVACQTFDRPLPEGFTPAV